MKEVHRVNRAIIMAAGKGTRMRPITDKIPKPLIKVNNKPMIETVIESLKENDIDEVHIVVGYLKEQFEYLKEKYNNIDLIDNVYYNECNNISSLYVARDYISNSIILDGDQIIYNANILNPNFEKSGYNCVWTDKETKEWLLTVKDEIITSCNRNGGKNGWQLFSISRWNEEDGKKLKKHLEIEFKEKNNTQIFWDDIALFCYPTEYKLGIYKMKFGDIIEIDDLNELIKMDSTYEQYKMEG